MSANTGRLRRDPIQFGIRHVLLLMLCVSMYFAMLRSTGPLLPLLAVGTFVLAAIVILLRIESLLAGGIVGVILAYVVVVFARLTFGPMDTLGEFAYLVLSYVIGVVCAADRAIRSFYDGIYTR